MENKDYLIATYQNRINRITLDIEELEKDIKIFVTNIDIPLEDRWDLFCKFAKDCNRANQSNPFEFQNKNFQKYLDNREFNRYEDVDIDWELDNYYEWFCDEEGVLDENLQLDIIEVKEECLNKFIYSYNYN